MTEQEKVFARKFFKLKIHESDGQAFENLFTEIMNYSEPEFQQIKSWGNSGNGKCDGNIWSKGIYFQVFAPEDIKKTTLRLSKNSRNLSKDSFPMGLRSSPFSLLLMINIRASIPTAKRPLPK